MTVSTALVVANKAFTLVGYIAYPTLLVLLWLFAPQLLARCIAVPAAGFVIVSVFRRIYDAPRPYEVTGKAPAIDKRTKGKSFPSRHTFCMFMIALTWMVWCWPVGTALAICGCVMAWIRVRAGVHYPRDVIAGTLAAAAFALVGYLVIPW